jgi:hypothetical protein
MKYLKKFNENKVDKEDLKKFIDQYLAFLIDMGFEYNITIERDDYDNELWCFNIGKAGDDYDEVSNYFKWDDVKYDMIPFFEILSKKFQVYGDVYFYYKTGLNYYDINNVINGIELNKSLYRIEFYIKKDY